jgi:hypothetical protein
VDGLARNSSRRLRTAVDRAVISAQLLQGVRHPDCLKHGDRWQCVELKLNRGSLPANTYVAGHPRGANRLQALSLQTNNQPGFPDRFGPPARATEGKNQHARSLFSRDNFQRQFFQELSTDIVPDQQPNRPLRSRDIQGATAQRPKRTGSHASRTDLKSERCNVAADCPGSADARGFWRLRRSCGSLGDPSGPKRSCRESNPERWFTSLCESA